MKLLKIQFYLLIVLPFLINNSCAETNLATVDFMQILEQSKVIKFLNETANSQRNKLQIIVDNFEKNLRKSKDNISKIQEKDSQNYKTMKQDFSNKIANVQQKLTNKNKELEKIFHEAKTKVTKKIFKITQKIAKQQNITLVVPKNFVFYAEDNIDITAKVLKQLDIEMPTLDIEMPELEIKIP